MPVVMAMVMATGTRADMRMIAHSLQDDGRILLRHLRHSAPAHLQPVELA